MFILQEPVTLTHFNILLTTKPFSLIGKGPCGELLKSQRNKYPRNVYNCTLCYVFFGILHYCQDVSNTISGSHHGWAQAKEQESIPSENYKDSCNPNPNDGH